MATLAADFSERTSESESEQQNNNFWVGDGSDWWNMTEEEVTGGKDMELVGGPGPLQLFGAPAGGAASAATRVTSIKGGLKAARNTGAKTLGKRAAASLGADLASGDGPASVAVEAGTGIETDAAAADAVQVSTDATEAGIDFINDAAENPSDVNPDNWVPGWMNWLKNHPKVALTAVALLVVLQITGPATELAATATEAASE